jgi:hypothetical protein
MAGKSPARQLFEAELAALVKKFDDHRAHYLRVDYPEPQARIDFVDPLFEALGWDVRNRAGLGPRGRDVVVELSGETAGRPDYTFRLDGRTVFFVEAKAPHVPLERTDVILQAKSYAWNSRDVLVAVVTDFEEFRLYDATVKPDARHPDVGLIFAQRYADYLKPDVLDDLWLLSKESVAAGSIERLLGRSGVKQRQRIPVDQAFLDDLTGWREQLAKAVHKAHPDLPVADLNSAVQVFLDRLIFVRIAEDRSILPRYGLRDIAEAWQHSRRRVSLAADLHALFREVNGMLNGDIFRPHPSEKIDWDMLADLVAGIIARLYLPKSPYKFDYIGVELLGSIYERYLGKTIIIKGSRVDVDDKPEVRKAGGVYYTPKYIVDYIVEQTVGKLIEGKTPAQIAKLRILDPACGSGSFLLGAYQRLLAHHLEWKQQLGRKGGKKARSGEQARLIDAGEGGAVKLSLEEKAAILRNNLHGVDIDPQAVEITMMSLYIKLLEGESGRILGRGVLPPLKDNIKCGNSLIGHNIRQQPGITDEDVQRINPFDWHSKREGFGEIMQAGGFDAVIGNPPYGATFGETEAAYFRENYHVFRNVKDVYTCFMEASLKRLRSSGRFSFIVPSAWLGGPEYAGVRQLLLAFQVDTVTLLPFDVFPDAYVDTAVFVIYKQRASKEHRARTYIYDKRERIKSIDLSVSDYRLVSQSEWLKTTDKKIVLDPGTVQVLERIRAKTSATFSDAVQIKRGVLFDKGLLTRRRTTADSYPYFEGDVYRYELNLVSDHWVEFSDKMKERPKEIVWFKTPRILLRRLVNRRQRLMATFVPETFITNKNLYSVLPVSNRADLLATLGVLNSRLISHLYINQVTQATKDDFPQVTIKDVLALPFPEIDKARHDKMVSLVQRMLDLHKQKQSAASEQARARIEREISVTDEQIDALVYELYGLSKEEIKIVESSQ